MVDKLGRVGRIRPFDEEGVERGVDGRLRYTTLPPSLVAMIRSTVDRCGGQEALVELGGERLSYHGWWARASRVAGGLRACGVQRADRVALHLSNGNAWAVGFLGIQLAGAVAVPVNTRFSEAEVDYVVSDSGSRVVLRDGEPLPDGDPIVVDDQQPDDLAAIFYTSGTTGFPKGAMTSHENFLANCETCRRIMRFDGDLRVRNLVSVPLFHVTGCNSQLLVTAMLGGTTVIMPTFDVQSFLHAAEQEQINILTSVPAIFWLATNQPNFADFDLSRVGWVTYGGAPMAPEVIARLRTSFPGARLGNGFGLTETSSVATFLPDQHCDDRPETVGFAAPVVELDLCEPDERGVGELLIRAQNVVQGYWNKPEQTADTFVDGWLYTGDLARIDDDGFVEIVDRKKDMVNRGGENVYCVEVENALVLHPDVFEVAVMGVPDTMMGEKVGAVVVARPGATVDPRELREWAKDHIADFKIPQFFDIRDEPLPRNPGGKVLKPKLRDEAHWGPELR